MTNFELYELLNIPDEVKAELKNYSNTRNTEMPPAIYGKILNRTTWDEGIRELQMFLNDDKDGIKILWELLNIVCHYSYEKYKKEGISDAIFVETMKFCTRFLREQYNTFGTYEFVWAWWFPRQLSMNEYRIGALEYEFIDGKEREIAIHIPSDANMKKEFVHHSLKDFFQFRKQHFPEWENTQLTCDTWMLMPELKALLGENSNIVAFQNLFEIETIDYEATWYMQWIYPGVENVDMSLPEGTKLQRRLKSHLLQGKKFGVAKGRLKDPMEFGVPKKINML